MGIREMNQPFSEGLVKIIKEMGFKKAHVAQRAGYSAQELSDMITGRRLIKACDIPKLAAALGVKIDDIYNEGAEGGKGHPIRDIG